MLNFQNPFRGCYPKPGSKEIAIEPRQIIIAGIVCISSGMNTIWSKITSRTLLVKPVKRCHGKEWSEFHDRFDLYGIGVNVPVIMVISVPCSHNEFITDKIVGAKT